MRFRGLLTIIAALALGQSAHAAQLVGSMTTNNLGQVPFGVDYTVPSDGLTYRWDFFTDSSHPNALISLATPNLVSATEKVSLGNGMTRNVNIDDPAFTWDVVTSDPGHLSILVSAPASYNTCTAATAAGTICGMTYSIFGDNASLGVNVHDAVTISYIATAIPEPAAWLLMTAGVFSIGAALRQRRRVQREAQAVLA
jgi:hypothetical protein